MASSGLPADQPAKKCHPVTWIKFHPTQERFFWALSGCIWAAVTLISYSDICIQSRLNSLHSWVVQYPIPHTLGQSKVDSFWIEYGGLIVPRCPGLLWEPLSMFGQITEVLVLLRKSIFCVFLAPKNFSCCNTHSYGRTNYISPSAATPTWLWKDKLHFPSAATPTVYGRTSYIFSPAASSPNSRSYSKTMVHTCGPKLASYF